MSTALIRQALEFVDPEESGGVHKKRRTTGPRRQGVSGQAPSNSYNKKIKSTKKQAKSQEQRIQENIKKLLALSQPVAEKRVTKKIIERAIKGKPLIEKRKIKKRVEKSILFPEDDKVETVKKFKSKSK